jgi:hypothetical protein
MGFVTPHPARLQGCRRTWQWYCPAFLTRSDLIGCIVGVTGTRTRQVAELSLNASALLKVYSDLHEPRVQD